MAIKLSTSFLLLFLILCFPVVTLSQPPIGGWRDHLPFHSAIAVCAEENQVIAASPFGLFRIELSTNTIERNTKASGLSGADVRTIGCSNGRTVIAYKSNAVDIVEGTAVKRMDAIQRAPISTGRLINHILMYDDQALLSTGFGIVKINTSLGEVEEQYLIGSLGQPVNVMASAISSDSIFAATDEGLRLGHGSNLQDFRNWVTIASGAILDVESFNHQIYFIRNDTLFRYTKAKIDTVYTEAGLRSIDQLNNRLGLIIQNAQSAFVIILKADNSIEQRIDNSFLKDPRQLVSIEDELYVADSTSGLLRFSAGQMEQIIPNSPYHLGFGDMLFAGGELLVTAGGINDNGQPLQNANGIYRFKDGSWINLQPSSNTALNNVRDIIPVAHSANDNTIVAGSFGKGLIEIKGDEITVFNTGSFISPAFFDNNSFRVTGLAYDAQNNLWISNDGAVENLLVRKADGTIFKFTIPFALRQNGVGQVLVDDLSQIWIIGRNNDGLIAFDYGSSIENTADDQWKWFKTGVGNGNLPDMKVLDIAKDKLGFIWIATARGVAVIPCPDQVFTNQGCEAIIPVIQQGNFAGFLLRDQYVQSIAVDGDNRKWFGTKSGAFLISSDGEALITRFTITNSPLAGNDVKAIAIEPSTGEVFFSTENGISSYRGTATEPVTANSSLQIFPNPVPPGYTGTIGIRGLPANSVVKITETNGRLVYEASSTGGQLTWNGRDYKGRQVASGVYLVLVTDRNNKQNSSSKIVILKK